MRTVSDKSVRSQAKVLGLSKSVVWRDRRDGCPTDPEEAKLWRAINRRPHVRRLSVAELEQALSMPAKSIVKDASQQNSVQKPPEQNSMMSDCAWWCRMLYGKRIEPRKAE